MPVKTESHPYLEVDAQPKTATVELLFEISELLAGLGIFLMTLAPLAVPIIALVLVPVFAVAVVGGLALAIISLPVLLPLTLMRRVRIRPVARELRTDVSAQ